MTRISRAEGSEAGKLSAVFDLRAEMRHVLGDMVIDRYKV